MGYTIFTAAFVFACTYVWMRVRMNTELMEHDLELAYLIAHGRATVNTRNTRGKVRAMHTYRLIQSMAYVNTRTTMVN